MRKVLKATGSVACESLYTVEDLVLTARGYTRIMRAESFIEGYNEIQAVLGTVKDLPKEVQDQVNAILGIA